MYLWGNFGVAEKALPSFIETKDLAALEEGCSAVFEENIPENDYILFKNNTSPEDIKDIKLSNAVITREGSILSHPAIVCRELNKPC